LSDVGSEMVREYILRQKVAITRQHGRNVHINSVPKDTACRIVYFDEFVCYH